MAYNIEMIGAGLNAASRQPQDMINKLQLLLDDPLYTLATELFKKRYEALDAASMEQRLIDHIDGLLKSA